MDDVAVARAIHVLAVVLWIGGVAFVTTALLPGVRRARLPTLFEAIEARFSRQARVTTQLAGLSGLYMVWRLDLWDRFLSTDYWWMHAMVLVWAVFTSILFVAEPLFLDRWLRERMARDPDTALRDMAWMHWGLLVLAAVTILGAVAGSHGLFLFG